MKNARKGLAVGIIIASILAAIIGFLVIPNISLHKDPAMIPKDLNDLFTDETLSGVESVQIERFNGPSGFETIDIPSDKFEPLFKYLKNLNVIKYEEEICGLLIGSPNYTLKITYANGNNYFVSFDDNYFQTSKPQGETELSGHIVDTYLYRYYYVSAEDTPIIDNILKICGIEL